MILKLGMKHQGMELYKIYLDHDPQDDLDLFYGKVNLNRIYLRSQVSVYRTIGPLVVTVFAI